MNDYQTMPWLDTRLPTMAMDHLWDSINRSTQETDSKGSLAGNISKSRFLQDKDDMFYENALKGCTESIYFRDWNHYYNVHIIKSIPAPKFFLKELWVNYQKQYEFNPPHNHSGGTGFSFVVFMKIPTYWEEQYALPFSVDSNTPCASNFQFLLGQGHGPIKSIPIPLSPEDEGRMLFFPAWLSHQVFPFYGTEEERITISGNILIQNEMQDKMPLKEHKIRLKDLEKQVESMKEMIKTRY